MLMAVPRNQASHHHGRHHHADNVKGLAIRISCQRARCQSPGHVRSTVPPAMQKHAFSDSLHRRGGNIHSTLHARNTIITDTCSSEHGVKMALCTKVHRAVIMPVLILYRVYYDSGGYISVNRDDDVEVTSKHLFDLSSAT